MACYVNRCKREFPRPKECTAREELVFRESIARPQYVPTESSRSTVRRGSPEELYLRPAPGAASPEEPGLPGSRRERDQSAGRPRHYYTWKHVCVQSYMIHVRAIFYNSCLCRRVYNHIQLYITIYQLPRQT